MSQKNINSKDKVVQLISKITALGIDDQTAVQVLNQFISDHYTCKYITDHAAMKPNSTSPKNATNGLDGGGKQLEAFLASLSTNSTRCRLKNNGKINTMNTPQARAFSQGLARRAPNNNTADKGRQVIDVILKNFERIPFPRGFRVLDKGTKEQIDQLLSEGAHPNILLSKSKKNIDPYTWVFSTVIKTAIALVNENYKYEAKRTTVNLKAFGLSAIEKTDKGYFIDIGYSMLEPDNTYHVYQAMTVVRVNDILAIIMRIDPKISHYLLIKARKAFVLAEYEISENVAILKMKMPGALQCLSHNINELVNIFKIQYVIGPFSRSIKDRVRPSLRLIKINSLFPTPIPFDNGYKSSIPPVCFKLDESFLDPEALDIQAKLTEAVSQSAFDRVIAIQERYMDTLEKRQKALEAKRPKEKLSESRRVITVPPSILNTNNNAQQVKVQANVNLTNTRKKYNASRHLLTTSELKYLSKMLTDIFSTKRWQNVVTNVEVLKNLITAHINNELEYSGVTEMSHRWQYISFILEWCRQGCPQPKFEDFDSGLEDADLDNPQSYLRVFKSANAYFFDIRLDTTGSQINVTTFHLKSNSYNIKAGLNIRDILGDYCYNVLYRVHPSRQGHTLETVNGGRGLTLLQEAVDNNDAAASIIISNINAFQAVLELWHDGIWEMTYEFSDDQGIPDDVMFIPGYDEDYILNDSVSDGGKPTMIHSSNIHKYTKTGDQVKYNGRKHCIYEGKRGGKYIRTKEGYKHLRL
jgi:hypothetical protein